MTGYCSLIIKGDVIDFDEIENNIGFKASKKYFKGDIVSEVIGKNGFDLMRFDEYIIENQSLNDTLNVLLDKIVLNERYIHSIQRQYDIVLKCYIQSVNAQVQFDIEPDNIARINRLGIKLDFSILSWGAVDND